METGYGIMVGRSLSVQKPHKVHVPAAEGFYSPGGICVIHIPVDEKLEHCSDRPPRITPDNKPPYADVVDDMAKQPDRIVFGN